MVYLGNLITDLNETIPPAVINAKTIWVTDGDDLPPHDLGQDVGAALIKEEGSGYLSDHLYVINKDKSAWVDVFKNHTHVSSADGGSLFDIKQANAKELLEFNFQNMRASQFVNTATNTATIGDNKDASSLYVQLVSPLAADYCDMEAGGLRLYFGKPFVMQAKYKVFENTNIIWRIGTGQSLINTGGNQSQICWEGCGNTDIKYSVTSANGSDRTPNYVTNMLQPNPLGLRIEWYPANKIIGTDGLGGLTTKTDNLPLVSAATNARTTFRVGLKATQATAGNSRTMRMYAAYLCGHIYDSQSGIGEWL